MTEITVQNITEEDIIGKLSKAIELNIETVKQEYMALEVRGVDDEEGYKNVKAAYMVMVHARTAVDKGRKALKSEALEYGRKVERATDKVMALLEPIETHLKGQKDVVDMEKKRIEEKARQEQKEKIQSRLDSFLKVAVNKPFYDVAAMTDSEFEIAIAKATEAYLAEQKRLADEESARKAAEEVARLKAEEEKKEQEDLRAKLKAQQEEIDKHKKEQAEAQSKIDAENARIKAEQESAARKIEDERRALEAEKQRVLDQIENEKKIEQAKKEAAEKALKEAAEKAERATKEKEEAEAKTIAEEARKEALRPDRQKLLNFLDSFWGIESPELKSNAAKEILDTFLSSLENLLLDTQRLTDSI